MADVLAPPEVPKVPEAERKPTSPLLIVGGTVVVVALVSFLIYSVGSDAEPDLFPGGQIARAANPVPAGECGFGKPDDSYSVALASTPEPPAPEGTTFRLTVRDDGRVISGAKVCMMANMPAMQHPGINTLTTEAGGQYETAIKFAMGGAWEAAVIIAEPGKPVVSVTVPFEVAEPLEN